MIKTGCFLFLISLNGLSQSVKLSVYEKKWAVFHPVAALTVKHINKRALPLYNELITQNELDRFRNGGKADAFRHVFFMGAFAQKIKVKKLRKLGLSHEKGNYRNFLKAKPEDGELADSLSSVMDLCNNELGFLIGSSHQNISLEELKKLAIAEIKEGKGVIMKRDKTGNYLDCNNRKTDIHLDTKTWNVAKCLVPSNYHYID